MADLWVPGDMTHASAQASFPAGDPVGARTRIVLRPIATPLPLGLLAQSVASLSYSSLQLHWIGTSQADAVALAVLVLTVPLQLIAAVMGFLGRDPVAGTGVALLAGAWAATSLDTLASPPGTVSPGLGVVLLCLAGALLVPTVAGRSKLAASAVMLVSVARFATTGLYEVTGASSWQTVAGWVGVALAAIGFYAALAFELEGTARRTVLPVGRPGGGGPLGDAGLDDQLEGIEHQAGVRRAL